MRILMIHPHDISSPVEPWTRRIKSLASELVKNNCEVRLVFFPLLENGNLEPYFSNGYKAIPFSRNPSPAVFLKNIFKLIELGRWADIIHFQKCHLYASVPAVISAYFNNKPLHYDWDDWEEMIWYESCGKKLHSKFIGFLFKTLERFLLILSDTVSVSSEYLKKTALNFGLKEENISLLSVGADLREFNLLVNREIIKKKYNIDGLLVLYVGQLHGAQHLDLFIKAANSVLRNDPDVFFMIVGEGFLEGQLKELANALGVSNKIIFSGSVSHDKIPEYIAAADICVASFRDTAVTRCKSPLKIVEYMAMSKAVVASNVGEVRKMLGGVGILVEPGNFHSLADGILRLLKDEDLRNRLGRFARYRVEKVYNWPKITSNLLMVYEALNIKKDIKNEKTI